MAVSKHEQLLLKAKTNAKKGVYGGDCNRTQCQRAPAFWFNRYTRAYYCEACARAINKANALISPPMCAYEEKAEDK